MQISSTTSYPNDKLSPMTWARLFSAFLHVPRIFAPKGHSHASPGQSEAPPWVRMSPNVRRPERLKGHNNTGQSNTYCSSTSTPCRVSNANDCGIALQAPVCTALSGLVGPGVVLPRAALRGYAAPLPLGYYVIAPSGREKVPWHSRQIAITLSHAWHLP